MDPKIELNSIHNLKLMGIGALMLGALISLCTLLDMVFNGGRFFTFVFFGGGVLMIIGILSLMSGIMFTNVQKATKEA